MMRPLITHPVGTQHDASAYHTPCRDAACSVRPSNEHNMLLQPKIFMITISHTNFTSDISLSDILMVLTKDKMMAICKKLDLYVSPNLKKDETARRISMEILANPINILSTLCKAELQLLDKIEKAGANQYIIVKQRKTLYKLQKYGLVLTYEDMAKGEWHLLMPDSVRKSLSTSYPAYLSMAEKGIKAPSPKELRMMSALQKLMEK